MTAARAGVTPIWLWPVENSTPPGPPAAVLNHNDTVSGPAVANRSDSGNRTDEELPSNPAAVAGLPANGPGCPKVTLL